MRATYMYGAGDVRVDDVPDPVIQQPTDALVRVTSLHLRQRPAPLPLDARDGAGRRWATSSSASSRTSARGQRLRTGRFRHRAVRWSDGTCDFCREGLQTSCLHGGFWDARCRGGQAEAVRVPQAYGTLVRIRSRTDSALLPSLLTLSDVYGTGYHAAVTAGVGRAAR